MKTTFKIVKFWLVTNANQLFCIIFVLYFFAQIIRTLIF